MNRVLIFAAQMLCFGLAIPTFDNDLFEGDNCTLADGTDGTCRRDVECDYLKPIPKKDWRRCSFDKNVSILCCRDESPSVLKGSPNQRRMGFVSERMCEGFLHPEASDHILSGTKANLEDFPYLGALAFGEGNDDFRCGANLISHEYVLTAAHCVIKERPVFVRLGVVQIFETSGPDEPVDIGIKDVIVHPNYTPRPLSNDIALLKLNRAIDDVEKEFLIPACLYTNTTDPEPDQLLSIAGWGATESADYQMSPDLMKANVTAYERAECNAILVEDKTPKRKLRQLNDDQLCALGRNATGNSTTDTCVGDSGGPLELAIGRRKYIVGLTSIGQVCGTDYPGIYTRVSHFVDWIESIVWPA